MSNRYIMGAAAVASVLIRLAPTIGAAGSFLSAPSSAAGTRAPFDRGEATEALGAVKVESCKIKYGPIGSGRVAVTFSPNGAVSNVIVDSPPFSHTSIGGCIADRFRGVHLPPFSGNPVTLNKGFFIR